METANTEWLLVFYSVPSHPVSNRMRIWRRLAKAGAVQLKGAVYVLPAGEEHEEFLQWLLGEVKSMGGDGAFVRSSEIRTLDETDIRELFIRQADEGYRTLDKELDGLERKVQSIRKGTRNSGSGKLVDETAKLLKEFDAARRRDFFSSPSGVALGKRMQSLETALKGIDARSAPGAIEVTRKTASEYQGRLWVTRKKPFIDRMASAWLIRRFIDPKAAFRFIDEREVGSLDASSVAFDVRGAEFTHVGDLCTFEVLIKSFGIKDKVVKKIAEIVHDLDVKDEKYTTPEASGIEDILSGIRKSSRDDADMLEQGMRVFEMFYLSRS